MMATSVFSEELGLIYKGDASINVQQQIASQIATAVSTKVDTSASANQTMAGTYTVSGTMNFTGPTTVETAPLPSAE